MDHIKFGVLISYLTSLRTNDNYDSYTVERIAKLVGDCQQEPNRASQIDTNELLRQVALNDKIPAIKAYRALTGASLLDAKNAVEKYWVSKPSSVEKAC